MSTGKLVVILLVLFVMGSDVISLIILEFSSSTYDLPVFANSSDELVDRYDFNNDGLINFSEYRAMHLDATFATLPSERCFV